MTQCSNANTKNKIVVTFHLISYRRMTKTRLEVDAEQLASCKAAGAP